MLLKIEDFVTVLAQIDQGESDFNIILKRNSLQQSIQSYLSDNAFFKYSSSPTFSIQMYILNSLIEFILNLFLILDLFSTFAKNKCMKIANNILETIGNTPMVKLNAITKGMEATVLAKVEYFNPGVQ